jgi:hypothetical protein
MTLTRRMGVVGLAAAALSLGVLAPREAFAQG